MRQLPQSRGWLRADRLFPGAFSLFLVVAGGSLAHFHSGWEANIYDVTYCIVYNYDTPTPPLELYIVLNK